MHSQSLASQTLFLARQILLVSCTGQRGTAVIHHWLHVLQSGSTLLVDVGNTFLICNLIRKGKATCQTLRKLLSVIRNQKKSIHFVVDSLHSYFSKHRHKSAPSKPWLHAFNETRAEQFQKVPLIVEFNEAQAELYC